MSDSQDFESQEVELEISTREETRPYSVKKYLQNPKELMQKILFNSFKIDPFFPVDFQDIPQMMKPDTAQKDTNNMNLIQQSAFRHEKLKKDLMGFLANNHLATKPMNTKNLPTMRQFYQNKQPFFEKYTVNPKSKYIATFLLDSKTILKQDIKKNNEDIFVPSNSPNTLATHRSRIQFSSNFQSGNLFRVYQTQYNQFDLVLQNDINTKGNNQWFFFMVKNVPKGLTLKFNIVNFNKKYSLFDFGMKPYAFSMIRYEKRKVGWVREGSKVNYEQNEKFCHENGYKPYYKLSFEHKFNYEGDIVYFSQSLPYRVSDLTKFIFDHIKNPNNARYIKLRDLNRTLGNQDLNIMEITDQYSRQEKKIVWVIARQHAGEVTSSFMIEGIINYLLNQSVIAKQLLKKYIFKIVPMINIDGVIHGNSRADLSGADPNRKWQNPHKIRNPIIWALKKCIEKDKGRVQMFLDLHSHSRKIGTFFYGNNFRDNKLSTRKYPWMVCQTDERFTFSQCRFSQINNASARHVLFQILKIPLIYTVESSFYGYQKNDHRIIEYLPNDYRQMGQTLVQTFWHHSVSNQNTLKGSLLSTKQQKMIKQLQQTQQNDKESIGSDSDPGQNQFQQKQLRNLLPNFYGVKKSKKNKIVKKTKNNQKLKKMDKQQPQTPAPKAKKNDKESHYRIYFSGRVSALQKKGIYQKLNIETRQAGIQASVPDLAVLKGSINISPTVLVQKRTSLCIWGQKVQQEVSVFGNTIGLQVDMMKMFQNKDQSRKSLSSKKNFKVTTRVNSILQVKQNNFLNRADCHTLPMRSLSKR